MAISKRLRYEVLRRDGFKCGYCHASEVLLTVDHVIPRSLGGSDAPGNLIACCDDCNTGKSSALLGGATVQDVSPFLLQWSRARRSPDAFLVEAAVLLWRQRYQETHDDAPDSDIVNDARDEIARAYLTLKPHTAGFFDSAQHAGGTGEFDLFQAGGELHDIESIETAVCAWGDAWIIAVGDAPGPAAVHEVRSALAKLIAGSSVDASGAIIAAVHAGSAATARLCVGLNPMHGALIGVDVKVQAIEDAWAVAWRDTCGAWPTEDDRVALRASVTSALARGHSPRSLIAAAVSAAACGSPDLSFGLPLTTDEFPAGSN